jgi:hypothetical protein
MQSALRIGIGTLLVAATVLACGKKERNEPAAGAGTGAAAEIGAAAGAGTDSGAVAAAPPGSAPADAAAGISAPIAGDTAAAGGAAAAGAAGAGPGEPAVITPADVDAYRRGQQAELERIERIIEEIGATTDEARKKELLGQLNDRTASLEHGARAAKMEDARYLAVSTTIEDMIVRWRRSQFVARMAADTTSLASLPPERQAKMRAAIAASQKPYAGLPPATVAAVSPRVAELDSLHVITGSLVTQTLRAAKGAPAGGPGSPGHP